MPLSGLPSQSRPESHRTLSSHRRHQECLKAGYDAIEHGTFVDDECIDLILQRDVPCVPALYFEYARVHEGPGLKMSQRVIDGHQETLDGGAESSRRILKAGGIPGMGGDYGSALESSWRLRSRTFVLRTLSAFLWKSDSQPKTEQRFGRLHEIGTVEVGKLADLLTEIRCRIFELSRIAVGLLP